MVSSQVFCHNTHMNLKAPPFKLYRRSAHSLVEQAVGGMKSAIASEFYQIGEKVLSLNDFSRCFRVSLKVPRMAYARLVSEGWLKVRHGVGFTAASPDVRDWRGRVLYVQFCMGLYQSVLCSCVLRRLAESGYRGVSIFLEDASRQTLESLEAALEDKYDIIFADYPRTEYEELFEKSRMPYVVTHGGFKKRQSPGAGCLGVIVEDDAVVRDLVASVRKAGIRSAACVDAAERRIYDCYANALRKAGIAVEQWQTPILTLDRRTDGFRRGAERFFSERLACGRGFPELLVFCDDCIAEGALYAMARAGVEIPRDVKVVTLYNKSIGLTSPLEFTRMEADPDRDAKSIVAFLVACMEKRRVQTPRRVIQFVSGKTL